MRSSPVSPDDVSTTLSAHSSGQESKHLLDVLRSSHPLTDVVDNLTPLGTALGLDLSEETESIRDKINVQLPVSNESDIDPDNLEYAGLLSSEEFECSICKNLLCEPITIPCGHTYCRRCLGNALTKTSKECPQCRSQCHIDVSRHPENVLVASLLDKHFRPMYQYRLASSQTEKSKTQTLPILMVPDEQFFPFTQMKFHLFEPRYNVMMRRILESGQTFVYIPKDHVRSQDFGLVGHVAEYQPLPNDRSCIIVRFGKRIQVELAWQEQGTFGLWYCEATNVEDAVLTNENCRSDSLLQDYKQVKSAFDASREIFVSVNFPKTEFESEPTPPNWIIRVAQDESAVFDPDELLQKSEQLIQWTFWAAGLVRQAYPDEFTGTKQIEILSSSNSCARLNLIANIVRNAPQRRTISNLRALFRSSNASSDSQSSSDGRSWSGYSAVSRLRRLLNNRRGNTPSESDIEGSSSEST